MYLFVKLDESKNLGLVNYKLAEPVWWNCMLINSYYSSGTLVHNIPFFPVVITTICLSFNISNPVTRLCTNIFKDDSILNQNRSKWIKIIFKIPVLKMSGYNKSQIYHLDTPRLNTYSPHPWLKYWQGTYYCILIILTYMILSQKRWCKNPQLFF